MKETKVRKKRRSKEDVAKAREAILKARMEKKQAREMLIKAREERKKERELKKLERERIARERAAKKALSPTERRKAKVRAALEKETVWDGNLNKVHAIPSWRGKIEVGDEVAFRFTGYIFHGKVTAIEDENMYGAAVESEVEEEVSLGTARLYSILVEEDSTIYPVLKKDILAKKLK